jgi:hypothetical protein
LCVRHVIENPSSDQQKKGAKQLPSPNPKQGIKLSSSKAESVLPIIDMACSYGFGVLPISCRQRRLKDILPNIKKKLLLKPGNQEIVW